MQAPYPIKDKYVITSKWGWRWLALNGGKPNPDFHKGWDFAAPLGTEVFANADGICFVGIDPPGFGNFIMIAGVTAQQNPYQVYYGHLKDATVKTGQRVSIGTLIGHVNSTGRSSGNHLHNEFRILKDRKFQAIDPKLVLVENYGQKTG